MISKKEVEAMMEQINIPFRYHHFEVEEAVAPPFICWFFKDSDNFFADGTVYYTKRKLVIELYTDYKDIESEAKMENILNTFGIAWQKDEEYIESEKMFEVIYEMEV